MSIEASECYVDWKQAELNGFSYCFHRMDGGLCGRSDSWAGHRETDSSVYHPFVKISTVFAKLNAAEWARDQIANHAVRLEAEVRELREECAANLERYRQAHMDWAVEAGHTLNLETECAALRSAMKADDDRLMEAGMRVGIWFGCDTADAMADAILELRALREARTR